MINLYFVGERTTLNNFKIAGGVFKEDKFISILQSVINLVFSITLVNFIGLPGIYIGTVIQGLVSNIWRPIIVYRVMFHQSAKDYFKDFTKYFLTTAMTTGLILFLSRIVLTSVTVPNFILLVLLTFLVPNIIFFILFRKNDSFLFILNKGKTLWKGRISNAK